MTDAAAGAPTLTLMLLLLLRPAPGYVGIGFASSTLMTNSDVVMGWIAGTQDMMVSYGRGQGSR